MHPTLTFRTVSQQGAECSGVDARQLHKQLGNGTRFNDWISSRIKEYGFEDGRDFFGYSNSSNQKKSGRGGDRRSKNYLLTINMAKELAMVERTDAGREIRRYLIDLEARVAAGDVTLADEIADRASAKDQRWLAARVGGKASRKGFTATLQYRGVEGHGYGTCTNAIYVPICGGKASEIRRTHNLKARANVRDALTIKQLHAVGLAECLAIERMERENSQGTNQCAGACARAATSVASALLRA